MRAVEWVGLGAQAVLAAAAVRLFWSIRLTRRRPYLPGHGPMSLPRAVLLAVVCLAVVVLGLASSFLSAAEGGPKALITARVVVAGIVGTVWCGAGAPALARAYRDRRRRAGGGPSEAVPDYRVERPVD